MNRSRLLLDVPLTPAIGSRFQPTGFPDLNHAEFVRPGGARCLLVESAQSMANRLEGVGWIPELERPHHALTGLPYVRVVADLDGRFLTTSRQEAHRLASAFVKDSKLDGELMVGVIKHRLGLRDDTPLAQREIAAAIFALDPLCLIHGVFFADSSWPGQPKISRALTAFIEAENVMPAHSGGVKRDVVRHALGDGGGTAEGYGSVPFHRTEWTAEKITASFSLDRKQIAGYGLGDNASDLLEAVALWEIRQLLDDGLRLRTACDLIVDEPALIVDKTGAELPTIDQLETRIAAGVDACRDRLGEGGALEVRWQDGGKKPRGS